MLSPNEQIIVNTFADKVLAEYVNAIKTKSVTKFGAVNSSGRLAASGEIRFTDNGFQLWAFSYIDTLIHGRKPGSFPPIAPIERWIDEKPISSGVPTKSLAYAIATKMAKEGNMVWRTHKGANSGLLDDVASSQSIDQFISLLASKAVQELTDDIVKSFEIKL